jgi:hypothetical protein
METAVQAKTSPASRGEVPYLTLPAFSQPLAVPVGSPGAMLGMLFVESDPATQEKLADRDLLAAVTRHFEAALSLVQAPRALRPEAPDVAAREAAPLKLRLHRRDSSVFVDGQYLIKGVAGALLWKLLKEHKNLGRTDFCYRELRLDPSLRLPDMVDNLGARLILLQQRLAEHCPALRIEKKARGLIRLQVQRPVELAED